MRLGNSASAQDGGVLYILHLNTPTNRVYLGHLVLTTSEAVNSVLAKLSVAGSWEWARAFNTASVTMKCVAANGQDLVIGCDMSARTQPRAVNWDSFEIKLTNSNRHSFVMRVSAQTGRPLAEPVVLQAEGATPTFPYCSIDSLSVNANGQISVGGAIAFDSNSRMITFGAFDKDPRKSRGVQISAQTNKWHTRLPFLASLQPDLACTWAGYMAITGVVENKPSWNDAVPMHHGTFNAVVRAYNGETFAAGRLGGEQLSQLNGAYLKWFRFESTNSSFTEFTETVGSGLYLYNTYLITKVDPTGGSPISRWDPAELVDGKIAGESFASDLCVTSTDVYVVGGFRGKKFEVFGGEYPGNLGGADDAKQLGFVLRFSRAQLYPSNICYVVQFDYGQWTLSGMATLTGVVAPEGRDSVFISGITKGSSLWFGHGPEWKNHQGPGFYEANRFTPFVAELTGKCDALRNIWAPAMTECSGQSTFIGRNQGDYNFTPVREGRLSYDSTRQRVWWGGCATGGNLAFGWQQQQDLLNRADFSKGPGVYVTGFDVRPESQDWLRQVTITYKSPIPQSLLVPEGAGLAWVPTNRSYVSGDNPVSVVVPYALYTDFKRRPDGSADKSIERVYKAFYSSGEALPSDYLRPNVPRKRYTFVNYQEMDTGTAGNNNAFLLVPNRDREILLNYQVDYAFDAVASVTDASAANLIRPEELSVLGNPSYATESGLNENLDVGNRGISGTSDRNQWRWGRTWIGEGERVQIEIDTGTEGQPFGERYIVHRYNGSGDTNAPDSGGAKDFTAKLSTATFAMTGPMEFEIVWKKQISVRFGPMPDSMAGAKDAVFVLDQNRLSREGDWLYPFTSLGQTETPERWYDYGSRLRIGAWDKADSGKLELMGWLAGGGHVPSSQGYLTNLTGFPSEQVIYQGKTTTIPNYHALVINSLTKPTFVAWNYGLTIYTTYLSLGQAFNPAAPQKLFTTTAAASGEKPFKAEEPTVTVVEGAPAGTTGANGVLWDAAAKRLVPIRPGRYLATFRAADWTAANNRQVMLDFAAGFPADWFTNIIQEPPVLWSTKRFEPSGAEYQGAHFRHIAGAPPVNLDSSATDNFAFIGSQYLYFEAADRSGAEGMSQSTSVTAAQVDERGFTCNANGRSVLVFSQSMTNDPTSFPAKGNRDREALVVKVVESRDGTTLATPGWTNTNLIITNNSDVEIASAIASAYDQANLGTGWILFNSPRLLINPRIYRRDEPGGPIIPVNRRLLPETKITDELVVVWYENRGNTNSVPSINWPYQPVLYPCDRFSIPGNADKWYTGFREHRPFPAALATNQAKIVYTASRLGSEGLRFNGSSWKRQPLKNDLNLFSDRFQDVQIYSQPLTNSQGYNPNEEHAFIAPAVFHHADYDGIPIVDEISPGQGTGPASAVFALRDDLNFGVRQWNTGTNEGKATFQSFASGPPASLYTSEPMVLVQYYDTALTNYGMTAYFIGHECDLYNYSYKATAGQLLQAPYPLNLLTGLKGCNDTDQRNNDFTKPETINGTFYVNHWARQATFWLDTLGNAWVISGPVTGLMDPYLLAGYYYELRPDFWIPDAAAYRNYSTDGVFWRPDSNVYQSIPWLPDHTNSLGLASASGVPNIVQFNTVWPKDIPILKVGETLAFPGGEHRSDNPLVVQTAEIGIRVPRFVRAKIAEVYVTNAQTVAKGDRLVRLNVATNAEVTVTAPVAGWIDLNHAVGDTVSENEVLLVVLSAPMFGSPHFVYPPRLGGPFRITDVAVTNGASITAGDRLCSLSFGDGSQGSVSVASTVSGKVISVAHGQVWQGSVLMTIAGEAASRPTPGLPGVIGWKAGQILFDSRNPRMNESFVSPAKYCARLINPLVNRSVPLIQSEVYGETQSKASAFTPANSEKVTVKYGLWRFVDLSASLQRRVYFDPINDRLVLEGYVSGRKYGDNNLTAAPDPVYVLEPNILTRKEALELAGYFDSEKWRNAVHTLYNLGRDPYMLESDAPPGQRPGYQVGLTNALPPDANTGYPGTLYFDADGKSPEASFGPGLALVPNPDLMNPDNGFTEGYVTLVENAHPGKPDLSPVTVHVVKLDSHYRYRGAIKTVLSQNVFDEKLLISHTGDFGGNTDDVAHDWWYMPAQIGDVATPEAVITISASKWKPLAGETNHQVVLAGDPSKLLGDNFFFLRYRHNNEPTNTGTSVPDSHAHWLRKTNGAELVHLFPWEWAGAGNSPQLQANGSVKYLPQLVMGWVKRVLDRVNPYEARFSDFYNNESPATYSSMIQAAGPPYRGNVALNPDKNVVENVGLIELYQTILNRARNLSISSDQHFANESIWQALLLAATRINQLYMVLGDEAYTDAQDPTIGIQTANVAYGRLAPSLFAFQNMQKTLLHEELALLRGTDYGMNWPVHNRLFWNFLKGPGEAAYAVNYGIKDVNSDGFIDEYDAKILFPQGHGDAWGHYLSASRAQYELLQDGHFTWQSFAELYNLMDLVLESDYTDETAFARTAAAKARTGLAIVRNTYRLRYEEDPAGQWQGYTDTEADRAWGVSEWATRAAHAAYLDWLAANWLMPYRAYPAVETKAFGTNSLFSIGFDFRPGEALKVSENGTPRTLNLDYTVSWSGAYASVRFNYLPLTNSVIRIERVRPIDNSADQLNQIERCSVSELGEIMILQGQIQNALDQANSGLNPLGLSGDTVTFDIGTAPSTQSLGLSHFDQIYDRALKAGRNALATYDYANALDNRLRSVAESTEKSRLAAQDQDRSYRNELIDIFGSPYQNLIGPGGLYPPGYSGPDLLLYNFVEFTTPTDFLPDTPNTFKNLFQFQFKDYYENLNDAQECVFRDYLKEGYTLALLIQNYTALDCPPAEGKDFYDRLYQGTNFNFVETDGKPITIKVPELLDTQIAYKAGGSWGTRRVQGQLQQKLLACVKAGIQAEKTLDDYEAYLTVLNAKILGQQMRAGGFADNFIEARTMNALQNSTKLALLLRKNIRAIKGLLTRDVDKKAYQMAEGMDVILGTSTDAAGKSLELAIKTAAGVFTSAASSWDIGVGFASDLAEWAYGLEANLWALKQRAGTYKGETRSFVLDLVGALTQESTLRYAIANALADLEKSQQEYNALVGKGFALAAHRENMNKRLAASTQQDRYADMALRVSRNTALQQYNSALDLLARYAYLAGKAYDYETNLDPDDPASAVPLLAELVRARTLGVWAGGEPAIGGGGIAEYLAKMRANYEVLRGQLGINNPQRETVSFSLRNEWARIKTGAATNLNSEGRWRKVLQACRVPNLYQVPEFKKYCRSFSDPALGPEPGLVIPISTEITAGKNFFGWPMGGGDQSFDPSHYSTRCWSAGVRFIGYGELTGLGLTPRVYFVPAGLDVMLIPNSGSLQKREWNVLDQKIPVPYPVQAANLENADWFISQDSLDGSFAEIRKFSALRAYADTSEMDMDTRLRGRSVWNTKWLLVIPGRYLHADADIGLDRLVGSEATEGISDIELVLQTYSYSGN